jgi:hypothetical protein
MRLVLLAPRSLLVSLLLVSVLLLPAVARAAPPGGTAGAPLLMAQEAPIERVVVYSDQARVHRGARVVLPAGPTRVILASLPAAARPDTVRVECDSAQITHVEVTRTWERLPRQAEGKALLAKIEKVLDEVRALDDEARTLRTELGFVESLQPIADRKRPEKEAPSVFVDTWRRVLGWADGRATRIRARLAAMPAARLRLEQQLQALYVEGRKLLPDAASGPALRVAVTLKGNPGAHRVGLSYVVSGVRWVPSYDLRYDPLNPAVAASYYALVTQQTGEDWRQARLAFSTIMPSHLLAVPELPTWMLGRTTTFTPTPRERWEPRPNPWVAPARPVRPDAVMAALESALARAHEAPARDHGLRGEDSDKDGRLDEAERSKAEEKPADTRHGKRQYNFESDTIDGALARPEGRAVAQPSRPSPRRSMGPMAPPPPPAAAPMPVASESVSLRAGRHRVTVAATPQETVPWTDTGYRPPYLDPDLPAASAKGHRFTMDAPGRHTVIANGVAARVPLLRERFSVNPVYKIVAGRSKAAYLTAEIFNSSGRPILRGHANLFTGATYSGQTTLETSVPGAKLLLPLGVDEGVKVNRMINQRTVASGVVFKDEVSEYTVTIEIANHRRHPIRIEVEDQLPVVANKDTKVEGFESSPAMTGPELDGKITYKGTIGAGNLQKVIFKFRIVRPKNWELHQHDG